MATFKTLAFGGPHWEFSSTTLWYASMGMSGGGTTNVGDAINKELRRQRVVYQDGTISKLGALRLGGTASTDNLIVRVNQADSALVLTSAADGQLVNTTDTLAVSAGQALALRHTTSNARYNWARYVFEPAAADGQVTQYTAAPVTVARAAISVNDATTRYIPFAGHLFASTTEASVKIKVKIAGTFSNFRVYVFRYLTSSSDYGAFTVRSRKNGANGNAVISVPQNTGSSSGAHTDLANTDHVAVDDEYNFSVSANSLGTAYATLIQCDFTPDTVNGDHEIFLAGDAITNSSSGSALYFRIGGGTTDHFDTTESDVAGSMGLATSGGRMFRLKVTANTTSLDQTFTLRKNGADTAVTFVVPAGTTGEFVDSTNSVAGDADDLWSYSRTGGGTGSITAQYFAMIIPGEEVTAPAGEDALLYTVPVMIGLRYCSQGQLLRPDQGQDSGAANGPGFGKLRRIHKYAMDLHRTRGLEVGVDFGDSLRGVTFRTPGGTAYGINVLYSGIIEGTLDSKSDMTNQISWQQCRAYPGTVLVVGGYIATQDK